MFAAACVHCRTESALSVDAEHRAVAGVDFIARSSYVDMLDGAVRAPVTVTILPVSRVIRPRYMYMYSIDVAYCYTLSSMVVCLSVGYEHEPCKNG